MGIMPKVGVKRSRKRRYRDRKKAKRAATLTVLETVEAGTFKILGGSEPRVVVIRDRDQTVFCTCGNGRSPCSHVLAVQLLLKRGKK